MVRTDFVRRIALLTLGAIVVASCGGGGSSSGDGMGTLNLSITDAPVDEAEAVWLRFTQVTLQGTEGSTDQGPVEIPAALQVVNLMDYTGTDSAILLTDLALPAGSYKLRLDADLTFTDDDQHSWIAFDADSEKCSPLPEDVVWSSDGETCRYPLSIPSGEQSGFKPKGSIVITAGGTSDITVEFDLRRNVVDPSNPNDIAFKLKPTGLRLVNNTEVGSIAGSATLPDECDPAHARVYLYDLTGFVGMFAADDMHDGNDWFVTSTNVQTINGEGAFSYTYLIGFVPVGMDYALAWTCDDTDDPEVDEVDFPFEAQVEGIEVVAGEETTVDL